MGLDITERKNKEEALANLVAGTATVAAEQFFPQLVRHLASALNVTFAAVTELSGPNKVSTLAVWHGNAPGEHLEYDLLNTPCAQVLKGKSAIYSRNVQAQFPKDKDLQTLQAESYVGVALTNEQEEPLGHLFIIDTKPYLKTDRAMSILKIFAARASTELIRQKTELKNAQRESLLTLMLNTGPGCIKRVARDGTLLSMNPAGLTLIEAPTEEEALGLSVFDLVTPEHRLAFEQMHQKVLEGNSQTLQFKIEGLKGTQRWMETYATPFNNPITNHLEHLAVTHDITLRKTSESLIHDQKDTLERLARGEGLQSILEHICRMIEAQSRGLRCSILLLEGDTLWLGVAPSLPATYSQKINGITIGPKAGSCGTAAFTKELVIVSDIAMDPLWERGHRLALNHGLQACWSTPLLSSKGQVLGTFAMYYNHPKSPEPHDLDLVKSASNLAAIAIERRKNEQALQDTMERFDLAVKGSYDGLWEGVVLPHEPWYAPHTPVWWSPRFKELLGFQDDEFPNVLESWTTVLHPDDKDRIFAALHAHIERRQPFDVEYRLLTKSDGYRWFSARGQGIWDDQGNLLRMAGSVRDITEKRNTEESLKRWASIFEHTQWGVATSAGTSPYLDLVNPAYAQMHGYTVQELIGQPLATIFAPEEHQKIPGYIQQIHQHGHASFESTHIRKDGTTFPVLITVSAVKSQDTGEQYRIANVIDLTEQKQYEEALTEMNLALAHAMPGISQIDPSGCYLSVNDNYANLLGREPSELLGQSWEHTVHPDDLPTAFQAYEETIHTGKGEFEARGLRKDGSIFYKHVLMVKADPLKNPSVSHHCFMRDITDRKEAENTLQISEHSIRELYEITSAQDSTFDDKIRSILRLGCQRFGLPIGTLTKRIHENLQLEYLHDPNDTWAEQALVPICDSICGIILERTTPLIFEDVGETDFINSSAYKTLGLKAYIGTRVLVGNHVYGSLCFLDRTPYSGKYSSSDIQFLQLMSRWVGGELERKQAEEALHEANERLRTLSQQLLTVQENERRQLARDLHDEIGQNLTAVKMNLHTLGQGKSAVQTHRIFQDNMQILDSMLKHVRELSLDLRPSLLDDLGLVAAVRWFVNRQAERAGWTAKIVIDDNIPSLHPDHATVSFRVIQEALTNVMRHAQATHVTVTLQMKDEHLDLLIADNGIGFNSLQILERSASGQTLGLLSMQERVRFLNGNLSITSQRNQGTQIRAHIPVTALVKDATAS
ncbi:MAG: PAS domain S-box protein [Nitrospirae bacterium]|nr:PAS domain S-box protein [Nitrospirota bacterium]MDA1304851.1 PAS domain S-box protein [Nitrospirota bacterium]